MTSIGNEAFSSCSGLTSVTVQWQTPLTITSNVFSNKANATLYVPAGCVEAYQGAEYWKDFNGIEELFTGTVTDAQGVMYTTNNDGSCYVSGYDYKNYSASIVIPASFQGRTVTSIGETAFWCCNNLASVTIPNSVTSIGDWAFCDCNSLTSIVVEAGNYVYDSRNDCNAIIKTETNELIAGCNNTVIPNTVTSIGYGAFSACREMTSITIPNSVTSIGERAFEECDGLTAVTIPSSVTSIGDEAFVYSGLTSVTVLWETPLAISGNVFSKRANATLYVPVGCVEAYQETDYWKEFKEIREFFIGTITDAQGVKYTGNNDGTCYVSGYENDYNAIIVIPALFQGRTVTSIGNQAFYNCSSLISITIPNSVTSIGNKAFSGCNGLTSVKVQWQTPLAITGNVFSNRANATLYVPAGCVEAYQGAEYWKDFNGIEELFKGTVTDAQGVKYTANNEETCYVSGHEDNFSAAIVIPILFRGRKVTSIGYNTFRNCSGLTSVTIPNSVTSIGDNAFSRCSGLTSVHISDLSAWCRIVFGGTFANPLYYAHHLYLNNQEVTNLVIPEDVTSIGNEAFRDCKGLTSVTIPNSVTSIGGYAFYGCSGLTSIVVETGNSVYDSRNNCNAIIETETNKLITGCNNTVIPNSVTSIGSNAFYGCSALTSITIPNSVTSIGGYAFYGCSGLTSIVVETGNSVYDSRNNCNAIIETETNKLITGCNNTVIPNSVTSIGSNAFSYCSGLTSVTIPNSVTSIEYRAFYGCSGLTSVIVDKAAPITIDSYCFSNRANATLYVPKGSKATYEAADYWKEFKDIIEMVDVSDISQIDNVLYIESVGARSGNTDFELSIKMKNTAQIRGFQFDLVLPAGVTPVTEDNEMVYWLNGDRAPKNPGGQLYHTVEVSTQDDGSYRFLCGAQADKTFAGNDGEVMVFKVSIADDIPEGDNLVILKNIKLTETDINNSYQTEIIASKLTILEYEIGDISGDGVVDVSDYIGVANHILGNTPEGFNANAADVNKDNVIDVSDYIGIANIILTGSIYGNANANARTFNLPQQEGQEKEPQ